VDVRAVRIGVVMDRREILVLVDAKGPAHSIDRELHLFDVDRLARTRRDDHVIDGIRKLSTLALSACLLRDRLHLERRRLVRGHAAAPRGDKIIAFAVVRIDLEIALQRVERTASSAPFRSELSDHPRAVITAARGAGL